MTTIVNKMRNNKKLVLVGIEGHHSDDWNTTGAFSTSHSMKRAFPAISLNSAPGSRDLINVAIAKALAIVQLSELQPTYAQIRLLNYVQSSGSCRHVYIH